MKNRVVFLCLLLSALSLWAACKHDSSSDSDDDTAAAPEGTTAEAADTTAPTVGTAVGASGTSATATTLSWGAATDDVTATAGLSYKVVRAASSAELDTASEADATTTTARGLVMAWTANTTSCAVMGLTASTTCYFAVLVKDAAGNESLYAPTSVTTTSAADTTVPTIGTDIFFSGTTSVGTTVNWGAAGDTVTTPAGLSYKVVQASSSAEIDTVSEADKATVSMGWTANTTSYAVTGLTAGTIYWFAVLVQDAVGNMSLYTPQSVTTTAASSALIAEYKFENSGNASTGSYNLTAFGSPTYSSSTKKEGSYSVYLNGSAYLYNNSTSISVSSGMTVSAWVYASATVSTPTVVTLYNSSSYYYSFGAEGSIGSTANLIVYDNTNNPTCTVAINSGTWYHVVFTVDASSKNVLMYVNGSVISDNDATANTVGTYIATITKIETGSFGGSCNWTGYIDDVRIYDKVLSATEISALYSSY